MYDRNHNHKQDEQDKIDQYKRRQKMENTKKTVTKDTVIGDLLKDNPEAAKVIQKYFGTGCFTCPGMKVESIGFGAMMHNVNPDDIIRDLNNLEDK